jgi:hypothetical protein
MEEAAMIDDERGSPPDRTPEPPSTEAEGDFRGPYGYGRPAHKSDPEATYAFRADLMRPLPVARRSRWK